MAKKATGKPVKKPAKAVKNPKKKTAPVRGAKPSPKAGAKFVYQFGRKTDGNGGMKPLLGGKGANLAEMCRIGLPVPPGFTITTEVCTYYYENKRTYPAVLKAQMQAGLAAIEQQTAKKFGDLKNPLLVSVRSGARDSMPGMMDTILNLGLNDQTVEALAGQDRQRALRLGLLSPLRPDVWRRGARRPEARR
jgi:pyruvate,orthophosphate dikinase